MSHELNAPVLSVEKLFDDFFVVPAYQRDYSWEKEEVLQLLSDICEHALDSEEEYAIGTIITTPSSATTHSDDRREVIDGQQRLTTLWLLHAAIRYVGSPLGMNVATMEKALRDQRDSSKGGVESLMRLSSPFSGGDIVLDAVANLSDGERLGRSQDYTRSQKNIVGAFEALTESLSDRFKTSAELEGFKTALRKRVKVIHVHAADTTQALLLFETTNNRGRSLSPSDLVKNMIFANASDAQYVEISSMWQEMDKTLQKARIGVTPFLRYAALSVYGKKLQDKGVATWYAGGAKEKDNLAAQELKSDPVAFVRKLASLARVVLNVRDGKTPRGEQSTPFSELRELRVKQALPVLLVAAEWSDSAAERLAEELADFFFVTLLVRMRGQDIEKMLPGWVEVLRQLTDPTPEDVKLALRTPGMRELPLAIARAHREDFLAAIAQLRYEPTKTHPSNDTRRIRYLLRHLCAHVQGDRWGKLNEIDGYTPHIEHVLAKAATAEALEEFGSNVTLDDIHGLGNLTLLESELNSKIGAGKFRDKALSYDKSNVRLTKLLTGCDVAGYTKAAQGKIATIWGIAPGLIPGEKWDSSRIAARLEAYTYLASEIWSPTSAGTTTTQARD
jgi:hypothetical protein